MSSYDKPYLFKQNECERKGEGGRAAHEWVIIYIFIAVVDIH